jgi:hypothetical protein
VTGAHVFAPGLLPFEVAQMLFLYDLPNWLMGVFIVATVLAVSYGGYFAFHRLWRPAFTGDHTSVAMAVLGVVATINSLLLAFSAISVWDSFGSAELAVVQEANSISALARDLAVYDSEESRKVRRMLRDYTEMVVKVEWREMRTGQANSDVWNTFDRMFQAIGTIEPDTPRRAALLPEIWLRTNELLKERRSRLYTSESEVPGTLWAVVLIGTVLTIVTTFVLPPTRFYLFMVGLVALSIGLVFFLVIAMDRPFAGKESISPAPFEVAIDDMQEWDSVIAPATGVKK